MRKKKKSKFPDLTGDGKRTRADILKGRGVIESEDFIGEVINRVEESFAVEDEISQILESLEEEGYDIESLTEEDLNEIFYGLRKRLGYTTAKEDRNDRFRRRIQKRKLKRDKANATKYKEDQKAKKDAQRQKDAEERYAPKKSDDKAVTTLATRGSGAEEKSSGGKPTTAAIRKKLALKADPGDQHLPNTADSTDIVRGARMALAEAVLNEFTRAGLLAAERMRRPENRAEYVARLAKFGRKPRWQSADDKQRFSRGGHGLVRDAEREDVPSRARVIPSGGFERGGDKRVTDTNVSDELGGITIGRRVRKRGGWRGDNLKPGQQAAGIRQTPRGRARQHPQMRADLAGSPEDKKGRYQDYDRQGAQVADRSFVRGRYIIPK